MQGMMAGMSVMWLVGILIAVVLVLLIVKLIKH
jgi:hypothetical protein